jgi:hypothetical protein
MTSDASGSVELVSNIGTYLLASCKREKHPFSDLLCEALWALNGGSLS